MYVWILGLLAISALHAGDRESALAATARADFDRVEAAAMPLLRDAGTCVQSQAASLAVAPPAEVPMARFRKGYCALAEAAVTRSPDMFASAAADFDASIQDWLSRPPGANEAALEPAPSGLRALAAIARLNAGVTGGQAEQARSQLALAVDSKQCSGTAMPRDLCSSVLSAGRQWLSWLAVENGDLYRAMTYAPAAADPAWPRWVAGKQAIRDREYAAAAAWYGRALEEWNRPRTPYLMEALAPRPALSEVLTELGGAQFLAGDAAKAAATLAAALKADSSHPRPYYLRARAEELAGKSAEAAADYSMASRIALAAAQDLASGEAHLYRGVMYYRRGDYRRAEDEFASALSFDIPAALEPDAEAWRYLAAVAGGACSDSRERLERALETASPYFPKSEARQAADACQASEISAAGALPAELRQ